MRDPIEEAGVPSWRQCQDCGEDTACRHEWLGPMCPRCQDDRAIGLRCRECGAEGSLSMWRWVICSCDAPLDRIWRDTEGDTCGCGRCT